MKAIAALGCAPHSGWAAVIGVAESDGRIRVLVRDRITMSAPDDPTSKQPYHTVEGLPLGEAGPRLQAYAATAARMAGTALEAIVERLAREGGRAIGVGILDSAGRKGVALGDILASHALIHSAEGDHFRAALATAAAQCGLPVVRIRARELDAEAAEGIGRPAERLRAALKEASRSLGPPWGADQKAAALLAWLVLARTSPKRGR